MDTHIVLSDTELKKVLITEWDKIPERNINCRLAYISGAYFAFLVVLSWELADKPLLTKNFWTILEDFENLSASDLTFFVASNSREKLQLSPEMVPNSGLLVGVTQKHYAKGFRDCSGVLLRSVRKYFASRYDEKYSHPFQEYLGLKMSEITDRLNS